MKYFFTKISMMIMAGMCVIPGLALSDDCNKTVLSEKYAQMLKDDQALRGRYIEIVENEYKKKEIDKKEKEQLEISILDTDAKNEIALDRLIERCGWPKKLDNNRAARSAFFIIQHAECAYQLKYLPMITTANLHGEIPNKTYTMLVDRILVRQGKLQKYGTEFEYGSNKLFPVEDAKNLNKRRREMGLTPLDGF